jgi:hypothetical protein
MPRFRDLKTNFVSGEIDDLLQGRSDIKHYFNAVELARNVVVLPQGGAKTRPGSRYLWTVPEVSAGVRSNVRLVSFQFSTEQTYLFVFHHLAVTIFRNGVFMVTVVTPYTSNDLVAHLTAEGDLIDTGISWTQNVDTLIVFHERFAPRQIQRQGSHILWALSAWELKNIPRFAFGGTVYVNGVDEEQEIEFPNPDGGKWRAGDTFTLTLEDEETDNIRWDTDADLMVTRIGDAIRNLPNVDGPGIVVTHSGAPGALTTAVVFTVVLGGTDGQRPWGALGFTVKSAEQVPSIDVFVTVEGEYPGEDVWSATRGWPRCGVFFQGRLWVAGSFSMPNTLWATRTGDPNDFNNKRLTDDYGIQVTSDTDDVPAFINIYAGRHLQIFSTAGEFYVPSSESEGVTPGNIVLRRTTSRGSKPGLRVFEVDGATIFVQRRGKALREFIFADVEAAYQANSISLLFSHLMRDPVGIALRRSSSTDDADLMFMPNIDGTMTVFCTLRTQEVNGATLWNTNGSYIDAAAILDEVYFATTRTINGGIKTMIEVMDSSIQLDCAKIVTGAAAGATIAWLPNTSVEFSLDGSPQAAKVTNAGGEVVFDREAEEGYAIGLGWPEAMPDEHPGLRWIIKTLPIETGLPDGAMMGRKRRIVQLSMRLDDTTGLKVNGSRIPFRRFGVMVLNQPPPTFTGIKTERGLLGWDYTGQIVLGDDKQSRATILALSFGVSV